jgi:glycosyltransferase involved in cell wall biosynthesis
MTQQLCMWSAEKMESHAMREKISACITAGNEEDNIRRCLQSVTWADEIVVVDSFSKDNTVAICREFTNKVYQHRWLGYIGQKNLIKDLALHPWILFIDADEEVSPALRDEIMHEFESGNSINYNGYQFPRLVWYLGRWIRHGDWYPDTKLRLFRKEKGKCAGHEPHDRIEVAGNIKTLKGDLYHYTYDDISDQILTLNKFSSITAVTHNASGRTFYIIDLLFRPLFKFFRYYFLKLGFLDGMPGLIVAVSTSFTVFIKYAKLWDLQRNTAHKKNKE